MQIYGPGPIHGPHSINPTQGARAAQGPDASGAVAPRDEVEISQMGHLLETLSQLPDVRAERVAELRSAIAEGTYETEQKLDLALERLLDEIG